MTQTIKQPIFSELKKNFKKQYEGKYVRYKSKSYIVTSVDTEQEVAILKKINLMSNWYASVEEETPSIRISIEKLSTETKIVLKLTLDKVDF